MYINYFNAIKTVINERLSAVKTVDWFNNQYNRYEELKAVALPAIYIEFQQPMFWSTAADGLQTADTEIKLHLVLFDVADSPEVNLNLASDLNKIMHRFILMDGAEQLSTELVRIQSSLKTNYDQLKVIELTYATELYDCSTMPVRTPVAISLGVRESE